MPSYAIDILEITEILNPLGEKEFIVTYRIREDSKVLIVDDFTVSEKEFKEYKAKTKKEFRDFVEEHAKNILEIFLKSRPLTIKI